MLDFFANVGSIGFEQKVLVRQTGYSLSQYLINHPGQLNLAGQLSLATHRWVVAMSTSQRRRCCAAGE